MAACRAGAATAAGDRVPQQRICQRIGAAVPTAFRKGLSQKGFVPGQNVIIETRQAEGHYEMLAVLADDLIRIPVRVIVAAGGAASARASVPS